MSKVSGAVNRLSSASPIEPASGLAAPRINPGDGFDRDQHRALCFGAFLDSLKPKGGNQ
jgi:hypothetical protein